MSFNFVNQNFDKCSIQGCCVQGPYLNSINEYVFQEIKNTIYYFELLRKSGYRNIKLQYELLTFMAETNLNFDLQSSELINFINKLLKIKNDVIYQYLIATNSKDNNEISSCEPNDISQIAKLGEQYFLIRQNLLNERENTLYTIIRMFLRSILHNIYELSLYEEYPTKETDKVFNIINKLNINKLSENKLLNCIKSLYSTNHKVIIRKYALYKEKYGEITLNNVNFSSNKNKCILISGKILKDLEMLLSTAKNYDVDIYTHGKMLFAHQYKYFAQNKHLKGQFQKNVQSLKYDFSSFPGPVILSHFSQNKFEGIYRGKFYTTSLIAPFGVNLISDNNFIPVFESAISSKGFKKASLKNTISVGYDVQFLNNFLQKLNNNILNGRYNSILFLGLQNIEHKYTTFFQKLIKNISPKTFVVALDCPIKQDNVIYFNSYYDYSLIITILENLYKLKTSVNFELNAYITDCSSSMIEDIMLLNYYGFKNIFIPECKKIPNSRSLGVLLSQYFNTHITNFDVEEDIAIMDN